MPTLTWVDATTGDPGLRELWSFLHEQVAALVDGRMEVELRHVGVNSGGVRHPATRMLNDAVMLAAATRAAAASDVLVLGCWGSPVRRVRAAVAVPVASLPEASAIAVATLAARAVVVTVAPSLTGVFADDLAQLGATGFGPTPVASYAPVSDHGDVLRAIQDPGDLIDRFDHAAAAAADAGADVVVVGCGYLAPILTAHGYTHVRGRPDIPVWDCNRLAVEHALMLHRLHAAGTGPAPLSYAPPAGPAGRAFSTALDRIGADAPQAARSGGG